MQNCSRLFRIPKSSNPNISRILICLEEVADAVVVDAVVADAVVVVDAVVADAVVADAVVVDAVVAVASTSA